MQKLAVNIFYETGGSLSLAYHLSLRQYSRDKQQANYRLKLSITASLFKPFKNNFSSKLQGSCMLLLFHIGCSKRLQTWSHPHLINNLPAL